MSSDHTLTNTDVGGGSAALPLTLGERLARQVHYMSIRKVPEFGWLIPLAHVFNRITSLPVPSQQRFKRTELLAYSHSLRMFELPAEAAAEDPVVSEGMPLAPHIRLRLDEVVGPGTEAVRVHHDDVADAVARSKNADAVTVDRHVYFRTGRFRPEEDRGFALLAHEASHVLQALTPSAAWRRATDAGVNEEEREASDHEQQALRLRRATAPPQAKPEAVAQQLELRSYGGRSEDIRWPPVRSITEPQVTSSPNVAPNSSLRPLAAPAARNLENGAPAAPNMPDFEEMRRVLYRDLMNQIRADFERGG